MGAVTLFTEELVGDDCFYYPIPGALCVVFNGSNHYDYLPAKSTSYVVELTLRAGDVIEYIAGPFLKIAKRATISRIDTSDSISPVRLDNGDVKTLIASASVRRVMQQNHKILSQWVAIKDFRLVSGNIVAGDQNEGTTISEDVSKDDKAKLLRGGLMKKYKQEHP